MASGSTLSVVSGSFVDVATGGTLTVASGGIVQFESGSKIQEMVETKTTASTGTVLNRSGLTVVKSTKTAKTLTMAAPVAGETKKIVCTSASATGFVFVKMPSTVTIDGTNWAYKFKKGSETAPTVVCLQAISATRWIETYRSVADGTALTSTST